MRRFYSLLFLFLMLLSTFGYLQFLVAAEHEVSNRVARRIVENENEMGGNLVLRVPMSLPYGSDDRVYKSARGEIVIGGDLYRFVRKKMYRDTLYLVCLKDTVTADARNAISDYSRSFAGENHRNAEMPRKAASTFFPVFCNSDNYSSVQNSMRFVVKFDHAAVYNLYQFSLTPSVFHPPC